VLQLIFTTRIETMAHRTSITLTLVVAAGISPLFALDGAAHPGAHLGHHQDAPVVEPAPHHDITLGVASSPAAKPTPSGTLEPLIPSWPWLDDPADTIGRCRWRAESANTGMGGVLADCEEHQFPITAGVFIPEYDDPAHEGLVNLSPGWWMMNGVQNDGILDGEGLSDSHPQIHGEPPPDGIETEDFVADVSGSGIHYVNLPAPQHDNEIRTLCCETLPAKPGIGALTDCHFETALVPVVPETHPDLAGQYVASLACSEGRITSGGCFTQFLHNSEWSLTGDHPYVDGDPMEMPAGTHGSTPTETGWACRLDQEPIISYPPDYQEGIGITALCCK